MKNGKPITHKEKPDEWVAFASELVDRMPFNYQNYDQERNTIVVSNKTYERLKQSLDEFRANNII